MAKMFVFPTDIIGSPYSLTCYLRILNLILDMILVTMDVILVRKYGLPIKQKMLIYKMEKLQVQITPTLVFQTSAE